MNEASIQLFNGFALDLARGCLEHSGQPVHLRRQSYQVLKYLVENRGHLISKDKLIENVWEGRAVTDGSLSKCIEEVREALGTEAKHYIRNVRGRGYIFDPGKNENGNGLSVATEIDVGEVVPESDNYQDRHPLEHQAFQQINAPEPQSKANRLNRLSTRKAAVLVGIATVAIAVAGLVYFKYSAAGASRIRSIAVLPFTNASGDASLEYLSDGVTENLIDRLAQLGDLKVIARSSSFKYKGKELDAPEVGRTLGVQALVTGRVVLRGDSLVISAELVNPVDRTQLWGEQYVRKIADVQSVQEEIARTISEKLRVHLSGVQEQRLTKHATLNPQAFEFYLNGLFPLRKGGVDNVNKALDYFNRAIALDKNFALASAGVAQAHSYLAGNSLLDPRDALRKSKTSALRALELDDSLAEAHLELAQLEMDDWNWAGAEREYKRAIELNPSLAEAHKKYSWFLTTMQRHTQALEEIEHAQKLDPLRVDLARHRAWMKGLARRSDEALEEMLQTLKTDPPTVGSHRVLGFICEIKGMFDQAIAHQKEANSMEGETTGGQCYLGYALAGGGKRKEALLVAEKLKSTKDYVSPTEFAGIYAMLKDNEAAMALLEKAYAAHDLQLQILNIAPEFDGLRSDPRFKDLVRRVGLP